MNIFELIEENKATFTSTEEQIAKTLRETPEFILDHNIVEIADEYNVSKSAILRFCKKLGYDGFSDFKYDLTHYLKAATNEYDSLTMELLDIFSDSIHNLAKTINNTVITNLAKELITANNIHLYGIMSSNIAAKQLTYRLFKVGINSYCYEDSFIAFDTIRFTKENDLLIFFSASGNTLNLETELIKSTPAKKLLITQNPRIKEGAFDEVIILPSFPKNSISFYNEPTYLYMVFIELLVAEIQKIKNEA